MRPKALIKGLLGGLPFTAEAYWLLRHRDKKLHSRFNLENLKTHLPTMVAQVSPYAEAAAPGKKVFLFASLHPWINHIAVIGFALRGLGHDVTLGYLPYGDYNKPTDRFDLRRQDIYARTVLSAAEPLLNTIPFLEVEPARQIPAALSRAVEQIAIFDTQYILHIEDVDKKEPTYRLRYQRNLEAARKAFAYFQQYRPEVVIIPNGMIQEYGAVFEAARSLDIPTVTYEFGEQDQRIWLARNQPVMYFRAMDEVWAARQNCKMGKEQLDWLESFLAARQKLSVGAQFAHLWQKADRAGSAKIRADLGLDSRPVVLLPTNVLGDSATLGRTVFTRSMAEWIERLIPFFVGKPEVQLVVRVHPPERNFVGLSVAEIIHQILPELPAHIHLIGAKEKVNTYDLMDIADLALVYTTHAGLEMATRGIPVLVSGDAHYRKRGFTLDADTWDEYFQVLENALAGLPGRRLIPEQVERARHYAYSFFCEYPRPFPWHLEKIWPSLEKRPMTYVLSPEGQSQYGAVFQQLVGMPADWTRL